MKPLINECVQELKSTADTKGAVSCGRVLQAAASSSCMYMLYSIHAAIYITPSHVFGVCHQQTKYNIKVAICGVVFEATIPSLLSQFREEKRPAHRQSLLDLIIHFVDVTKSNDIQTGTLLFSCYVCECDQNMKELYLPCV